MFQFVCGICIILACKKFIKKEICNKICLDGDSMPSNTMVPLSNSMQSQNKTNTCIHITFTFNFKFLIDVGILIPQAMGKTFNEIRGKCGRIFFKVRRAILNNPPPIKDIKILLQDCYTDLKPQLVHVNTIDEILDVVRDKCTLTDISYLETIVEELDIKEAKVHIQTYKISIEAFCTTVSVRLCLDESFRLSTTSSSLKCETATFILDWNPDDYVLDDIRDVLSECFERLSKHVQINIIKKTNSIAVTCTFPFSLTTLLIAKAQETIDLMKKRELMKLTIGQSIIFAKNKRDEVYCA